MEKRVIWLTASMSVGKSTQRRKLCNALANGKMKVHTGEENGKTYYFTQFGGVSAIGKVKQEDNGATSACDGLDSVFGKVKKEGGIYSVDKALQVSEVVVLEGSQTSPSWGELLQPILKKHKAKLYLVHLKLSYWDNFLRLIQRQSEKRGDFHSDDPLPVIYKGITDKNIESLIGKNRQFNNCFDKCEGLAERLQVDAYKGEEEIFEEILNFCFADL